MTRTAVIVSLALWATGCYSTPTPECAFLCGQDGACPSGYTCRSDNWCKRTDLADDYVCDPTLADAAVSIDADNADADTTPDGSTADADTTPDGSTADADTTDAPVPDAMTPDAMPPDADTTDAFPNPSCALYCQEFLAACTGPLDEYGSSAICNDYCTTRAQLPLGTSSDTSGNTVGCRSTHAGFAAGNPATHCPHAGKTGGNTCGTWCENYCHLVNTNCSGTITFTTDCMTDCSGWATTGNPGDTTGDTVQCRIEYAGRSSNNPADCAEAAPSSTMCQ